MNYKILVIAPVWVGDLVMSQTLFIHLQHKYQNKLSLDVFATSATKDLVMRMPQVNQVIINPFKHGELRLWQRIKLGLGLRKEQYDEVIVLPSTLKSAIVPFFARIKCRTGFVGEGRYLLLNNLYKLDKQQLPKMVDRYCALANNGFKLNKINYPRLQIDNLNQEQLVQKFKLYSVIDSPVFKLSPKEFIAFCPAAEYGPAKRWLPEHFAILADLVADLGYQVVLFGGETDKSIGQQITRLTKTPENILNLCGQTSLVDAVDLLAMARCVVTNDSGLMHVAAAGLANIVAIYGSSSPEYTPPLSDTIRLLQVPLECAPCFERTCCYGHYNCLRFISPVAVFNAINDLIK